MSAHETPRSSGGMHTLGATKWIPPEIAIWNLKNIKFWCVGEGALPLATPINPYLGGSAWKKLFFFQNFSTYVICQKLYLKAKITSGESAEPPEVSGGAPCQTDMDCIERVKCTVLTRSKWPWLNHNSGHLVSGFTEIFWIFMSVFLLFWWFMNKIFN